MTRFYLSANSTLDGGDVLLPGVHIAPDLAAGASASGSTTLVIPQTAPGPYNIIAKADADNVVIESRETNNTQARTIQIGGDLIVSTITAPAKAGADVPFAVSDTTTNQGGGPVGPTVTKIYLSANTTLDSSDPLVGSRAIPDLAAGATNAGTTVVTIPSNTPRGSVFPDRDGRRGRSRGRGARDEQHLRASHPNRQRSVRVGPRAPRDRRRWCHRSSSTTRPPIWVAADRRRRSPGSTCQPIRTLDAGDVRLDGSRAVPALAARSVERGIDECDDSSRDGRRRVLPLRQGRR